MRASPARRALLFLLRAIWWRVKSFFSVGLGGALPRWDCPTFVSRKTTTEKKDLSPAAPRLLGRCARIVPVFVPTWSLPQKRGAAAFGVGVRVSPTALSFLSPRPRACAREIQTRWLNCRCSWARRGGVGVVRCVSPTAASGTFHPAPPSACAVLASPLCRACPLRLSGRSRSVVCSSCRRCAVGASLRLPYFRFAPITRFPTDSPRMTGATRSAKPPKTERGVFRSSELGERTAPLPEHRFATRYRSGICARFSASGGRLALSVDFAPAGRAR